MNLFYLFKILCLLKTTDFLYRSYRFVILKSDRSEDGQDFFFFFLIKSPN